MDRLIGVCESNDEPVSFFAFSSTVPIAKIRAFSNPWIFAARRRLQKELEQSKDKSIKERLTESRFTDSFKAIDQDFAADGMMFSKPVPIDSIGKGRYFFGRNGDMVNANWIRVFGADRIEFGSSNVSLMNVKLSQANTIALKAVPKVSQGKLKQRGAWMAMLRDNSVLEWNPNSLLRSATLNQDLSREDVIAIWPATKRPQMPLAGDFDDATHVLVYPGCRVATSEVLIDKNGFRWKDGKVRQENLQVPTIWFEKPTSLLANQGSLRLDNGEVLVYGPNSLTELKSIDRKQATLTFRGKEVVIPLSKIVAIVPPQVVTPQE